MLTNKQIISRYECEVNNPVKKSKVYAIICNKGVSFNTVKEALDKGIAENDINIIYYLNNNCKGKKCISTWVDWIGYTLNEYISAKKEYTKLIDTIPKRLLSFISTRDKKYGINDTDLLRTFQSLLQRKKIHMHCLTTCGRGANPSGARVRAFNEIIKKANALGYDIEYNQMPSNTKWATLNGGWNTEYEYILRGCDNVLN